MNHDVKNQDDFNLLIMALESGKGDDAMVLMASVLDVGAKNKLGETALHCAARKGLTMVCDALIARGVDMNPVCQRGYAPLHFAAECGWSDLCGHLIESGALVDLTSKTQWGKNNTPLQQMCIDPSSGSPRVLLRHGASVHAKNKDGRTALHTAAISGHTLACIELLAAGADPMKKFSGRTAAGLASHYGNPQTEGQIRAWIASNNAQQAIVAIGSVVVTARQLRDTHPKGFKRF